MSLVRWEPFGSIDRKMLDRFFGPTWRGEQWQESPLASSWTPTVDAHEQDGSIQLTVELPGVDLKDVALTVENNVLTIRGERRAETGKDDKSYHWRERAFGTFERSFTLPATVDRDNVQANYKDGVLEVVVPQKAEAKPRQIAIKAA